MVHTRLHFTQQQKYINQSLKIYVATTTNTRKSSTVVLTVQQLKFTTVKISLTPNRLFDRRKRKCIINCYRLESSAEQRVSAWDLGLLVQKTKEPVLHRCEFTPCVVYTDVGDWQSQTSLPGGKCVLSVHAVTRETRNVPGNRRFTRCHI